MYALFLEDFYFIAFLITFKKYLVINNPHSHDAYLETDLKFLKSTRIG